MNRIAMSWSFFTSLLIGGLPALAKEPPLQSKTIVDELVQLIEKHDEQTRKSPEAWQQTQKHLYAAAEMTESLAGLHRSLEDIFVHWNGRGLRLWDTTKPAYYAFKLDPPQLYDAGAWFAQRGAKWYVRQLTKKASPTLHRGDAILLDGFHPVKSWAQHEGPVRIQSQALGTSSNITIRARPVALSTWALEETQAASSLIPLQGKKICQEKLWLWLDASVDEALSSKIRFAQDHCDALVVDLRNSSGPGTSGIRHVNGKHRIPTAILINKETSEGVVSLAIQLKKDLEAHTFGEPSASRESPLVTSELKSAPWILAIYPHNSGSLIPDDLLEDSWIFAEGHDAVLEKASEFLRKAIGLN